MRTMCNILLDTSWNKRPMLTWTALQAMHEKIDSMTWFTQRDKVLFNTIRYLLIEHADLKIKHEKLQKKHRKTKKKQDV